MSDDGEHLLIPEKMAFHIEVPNDLLMDYGIIPDTREHKPLPKRVRFRWWLGGQRESFAAWLYCVVSGRDFPDPDDY